MINNINNNIKLGVNIDHCATLRNVRNSMYPDIVEFAYLCKKAKADLITVHLREDRRHIKDKDVVALRKENILPINLEIACTTEMQKIALDIKPAFICLVPEKREELTTEGGLNLIDKEQELKKFIQPFKVENIKVSAFLEADNQQIKIAKDIGFDNVEIHTGNYANNYHNRQITQDNLNKIRQASILITQLNMKCHAGHGLNYDNVKEITNIPDITELNIGHFLIAQSLFYGIENAIEKMLDIIQLDIIQN